MDTYLVVLYVHIMALAGAFGGAAVMHICSGRLRRTDSVAEARMVGGMMQRTAPVFPIMLLVLLASGGWMAYHRWSFTQPWVQTGIGAVVLLFVIGGLLGKRMAVIGTKLREAAEPAVSPDLRAVVNDPAMVMLVNIPAPLAMSVAFTMTLKLTLGGGIVAVVAFVGLGVAAARPFRAG